MPSCPVCKRFTRTAAWHHVGPMPAYDKHGHHPDCCLYNRGVPLRKEVQHAGLDSEKREGEELEHFQTEKETTK